MMAHCVVVLVSNSINEMSCAQRSHHWQKLVHAVETVHRNSEHFALVCVLIGKVSFEEQFEIGIKFY